MKGILYRIITLICLFMLPFSPVEAKNFVVVIDAGHGGKDAGSIDNDVKEKDINLGVAQRLADLLRHKLKEVKVVMTRDDDTYLTLQQRADKANSSKGDIFISIHSNSVDMKNPRRKTVKGASTHVLGLHKDANNMAVARRENSVMKLEADYKQKYSGFDPNSDESYIIFEMAQKKNLSRSISLANDIQKQLSSTAGRKNNGVHQNGFWVLWATSMPAVLVELDFICNPESADFISSKEGQNKLATAIFNAVKKYYNDSLTNKFAENESATPTESVPKDYDAAAVVGGMKDSERSVQAPATALSQSLTNGKRRRRSESSRNKSISQNYEVSEIKCKSYAKVEIQEESPVPSTNTLIEKKETTKSKKSKVRKSPSKNKDNAGQKRKVNGKTVTVTGSTAVAATKNSVSSLHKVKHLSQETTSVVKVSKNTGESDSKPRNRHGKARLNRTGQKYQVQLLVSDEKLDIKDPRFKKFQPVTCIAHNDTYSYLCGKCDSLTDAQTLLDLARKNFTEAVIVTTTTKSKN